MTYSIFGVRLDEVASVQELRRICGGFLDGPGTARVFTPKDSPSRAWSASSAACSSALVGMHP